MAARTPAVDGMAARLMAAGMAARIPGIPQPIFRVGSFPHSSGAGLRKSIAIAIFESGRPPFQYPSAAPLEQLQLAKTAFEALLAPTQ